MAGPATPVPEWSENNLADVEDAAALLGVSRSKVYELHRKGVLYGAKVAPASGGRVKTRFRLADLVRLAEEMGRGEPPKPPPEESPPVVPFAPPPPEMVCNYNGQALVILTDLASELRSACDELTKAAKPLDASMRLENKVLRGAVSRLLEFVEVDPHVAFAHQTRRDQLLRELAHYFQKNGVALEHN